MAIQKSYIHKIYSPTGTYLGLLDGVVSEFSYNQLVNTSAVQVQITVAKSADVIGQANTPILDETGNPVLDENSNPIYDEGVNDIVGSNNSNALIANNNQIKIYEVSSYYPNGLLVFTGYISKWKAIFGADDDIIITAISNGSDLANYLVSSGDTTFINQTTDDSTTEPLYVNSFPTQFGAGQTFTVPTSVQLGAISVELTTPEAGGTLTITVCTLDHTTPNPIGDTKLATGSVVLGLLSSKTVEKVQFSSLPTLSPGTTYYFWVEWLPPGGAGSGDTSQANLYANSTNPYANGQAYTGTNNFTGFWTTAAVAGTDLYFIIWQHGGAVTGTYVNDDPSFILADVLSSYASQGGLITQPGGGYANTGQLTSYTFKVQTILQAVQAILAASPANWYWYVDPASGILNFAQSNTVADFVLIKGRHINELDLEATRENIKNIAYLTGGDDGTATNTNIFVRVANAQGSNRVGLALLADNRINSTSGGTTVAKQVAQNFLNNNAAETYITTVTIEEGTIDTNLLKPGKMIGFAGFSPFVNQLILQVVGINKNPDQTVLQLGTLPVRSTQAVAQIQSGLAYQQTVDNPSTPS